MDRVVALREGTVSGVERSEAAEAVRLLAERKIVDETIERKLLSLVDLAQRGAAPVVDTPVNPAVEAAFTAYRNWLNEWREVARSTFTRRDHLIGLGLAFRKEAVENTAAPEA